LDVPFWAWPAFLAFIGLVLVLDLYVFHREAHAVEIKEAFIWSMAWIVMGTAFAGIILWWAGAEFAGEYLAGYVIEKSLSVDNIFVFALIFGYFNVPREYQHRVLEWGIIGAIFFRIIFIALGANLLNNFDWMFYVFGAFLVFTGLRMAFASESEIHPENNPALRLLRRIIPITSDYHGTRFFVRQGGLLMATPLVAVLITIETTDIIFAVDSIPAIFAVTNEPFIVLASNAFAILGLRMMYFLLAGAIHRFIYLKPGLAAILVFVGIKMALADIYHMPILLSLGVICAILTVAMGLSLIKTRGSNAGPDLVTEIPEAGQHD
jgi:tellurite resistance protein TerC